MITNGPNTFQKCNVSVIRILQLYSVSTICTVTMNTQHQETIKAIPYQVVFGTSPSSVPVPELCVIDEQG